MWHTLKLFQQMDMLCVVQTVAAHYNPFIFIKTAAKCVQVQTFSVTRHTVCSSWTAKCLFWDESRGYVEENMTYVWFKFCCSSVAVTASNYIIYLLQDAANLASASFNLEDNNRQCRESHIGSRDSLERVGMGP